MDWERQLISCIARKESIEKLLAVGIEDKHFEFIEGKPGQGAAIFAFMMAHLRQWNDPPSFGVVAEAFPDYDFVEPHDKLDYIITQFLSQVKYRETRNLLFRVASQIDGPNADKYLEDVEGHLLSEASELALALPKANSNKFSSMKTRVAKYVGQDRFGIMKGIPYPFPALDSYMHGIQKHEVVTISGWSGLGKSYLGLLMCFHAYMNNKTPLIISLEMSADAINRRLDVMATKISHTAMRKVALGKEDVIKWSDVAERVEKGRKEHDIIILDSLNHCTADRVYAETIRYKPDLVMIDYISLMDGPNGFKGANWEKLTEISRRLKSQAQGLQTPIISIAQTNRSGAVEGARDSNLAYSNAMLQDSDVLFGLHSDDGMKKNKKMELRLLKNRDGDIRDFELFWDVDNGIFREWHLGDMMRNTNEKN